MIFDFDPLIVYAIVTHESKNQFTEQIYNALHFKSLPADFYFKMKKKKKNTQEKKCIIFAFEYKILAVYVIISMQFSCGKIKKIGSSCGLCLYEYLSVRIFVRTNICPCINSHKRIHQH